LIEKTGKEMRFGKIGEMAEKILKKIFLPKRT
jgi:hypothetical protein